MTHLREAYLYSCDLFNMHFGITPSKDSSKPFFVCIYHTEYHSTPHNAQYQFSGFDLRSGGRQNYEICSATPENPIPFSQGVRQVSQYPVADRPLAVA